MLGHGVTVSGWLKKLEARPGDRIAIPGIGGLGHMAVQCAKAMGFNVVAVDIHDSKVKLARDLGADLTFHAAEDDPVGVSQRQMGGVRGVLVKAVSNAAFGQAVGMLRRGGFPSLNGLPPGDFPLPIFEVVLKRITVLGSIVGTRNDLAESLAFAAEGKGGSAFQLGRAGQHQRHLRPDEGRPDRRPRGPAHPGAQRLAVAAPAA